MATAKLKDFYSYYNEAGTAEIQALTKQLEGQLEELRKQDEAGSADWYRDNRVKAIEDLKDNYDKIRQSLENIVELEEEMQKKIIESLEDTNDKLEDQTGLYENINKQLEHNVELVKLVSGESSYDKLQEFYDKEAQNRKEQLAFQTQRKEYLEQLLIYFNKLGNIEAAKKVQEELDAVSESWATLIETTINANLTNFQNRIDNLFKKLEDKLTGGMGLDYLEKE
jgi:plasmid stabilization system protein ParE